MVGVCGEKGKIRKSAVTHPLPGSRHTVCFARLRYAPFENPVQRLDLYRAICLPYYKSMELEKLAVSYYKKARARRKALDVLFQEESYSDVVREAQEICELLLKGLLRIIGIEPPKFHDVGKILKQNIDLLPPALHGKLNTIARHSFELRKDRELAFYGALDVDPWEDYTVEDAKQAMEMIDEIFLWVDPVFSRNDS